MRYVNFISILLHQRCCHFVSSFVLCTMLESLFKLILRNNGHYLSHYNPRTLSSCLPSLWLDFFVFEVYYCAITLATMLHMWTAAGTEFVFVSGENYSYGWRFWCWSASGGALQERNEWRGNYYPYSFMSAIFPHIYDVA